MPRARAYKSTPFRSPYKVQKMVSAFTSTNRRPARPAARVIAGVTRTGGYYGRFNNAMPQELKFWDVDIDNAAVAAAGSVFSSCNLIPQGVTESTRVGRKCVIKKISWRCKAEALSQETDASENEVLRIVLVLDKQTNGATFNVTDLLEAADFQSFNNLANSQRFSVLMDKTVNLMPTGGKGDSTTEYSTGRQSLLSYHKKCNIPLEFSSTTGAITELRSNNLAVLLISEKGVAKFASKMRIRFSE